MLPESICPQCLGNHATRRKWEAKICEEMKERCWYSAVSVQKREAETKAAAASAVAAVNALKPPVDVGEC